MPNNILVPIITDNALLFDPLIGGDTLLSVLETANNSVREMLRDFAQSPEFAAKMELAFGVGVEATDLRQAWVAGEFALPPIEIRPRAELNGAYGAFAVATGKIYLAQELLENRALEEVVPVLLEEYGHFVDAQLNAVDAPGDEGAIFSALVRGETLAESQLGALKTEDDTATVQLDGQVVQVEQAGATSSNPFYQYKVIAKTGNPGIQSIANRVSINDAGKVAFVGDTNIIHTYTVKDENGNDITKSFPKNAIFVGDGSTSPINITPSISNNADSNILFGAAVQINNNNQVIASYSKPVIVLPRPGGGAGPESRLILWDANSTDSAKQIASGGGFQTVGKLPYPYSFDYYSVLPIASVNNKGQSVFVAFDKKLDFFIGPPIQFFYTLGDRQLVTASIPPNPSLNEDLLSGSSLVQPMIADNGDVIISQVVNGKRQLNLYDNDLGNVQVIASPKSGFTQIGTSPGISDDGSIVVFYGEVNATGATKLKTNPGEGIFAAIKTTIFSSKLFSITGWRIERIAGIAGNGFLDPGETFQDKNGDGKLEDIGVFSDFDPNARVAVNSTHRSEPFDDQNKNGLLDVGIGETFTDQDGDGVFDVSQRAVTIAYVANDNIVNVNNIPISLKGIYTSRLNFFGDGKTVFNPFSSSNQFSVSSPTLVIEQGDSVSGLSGNVKDVNIYDPLNNRDRGDVAFWVQTNTDEEAVVRYRPKEVIYLDFDPKNNFSAGLDLGSYSLFQDLGAPLTWDGNIASIFSSSGRTDLADVSTIQSQITQKVQEAFNKVDIDVEVRSGPQAPTDSYYTRVYIGDSPFSDISGLDKPIGISTSVDLFNQGLFNPTGKLAGTRKFGSSVLGMPN